MAASAPSFFARVRVALPGSFGPKDARRALWLGAGLLMFGVFLEIATEVFEHDDVRVHAFDVAALETIARHRIGWLNGVALDLTALGSTTIVTLLTVCGAVGLWMADDRRGSLQVALAAVGAGVFSSILKVLFGRARPDSLVSLFQASGFSFPSGHTTAAAAVYVTFAVVLSRHVRAKRGRVAIIALSTMVVTAVGASRMYLGVHFPSDVAGGLALGMGWACLLTGAYALREVEAPLQTVPARGAEGIPLKTTVATAEADAPPRAGSTRSP